MITKRLATLCSAPLLWMLLFFLASGPGAVAQPKVQLGILEPSNGTLQFNLKPDAAFSGVLSASVVTVRWQTTAGVTVGGTVTQLLPSPNGLVGYSGLTTDGIYSYATFASEDFATLSTPWVASTEVPFFSVPFTNTSGACVNFELVLDTWQIDENLRWFISLNGLNKTDLLTPFIAGKTTVVDDVAPVVAGSLTATPVEGCAIGAAPAAVTTVAALEALTGDLTITDACTADAALVVTHSDASTGTCPIVITRTYTITDASSNSVQVVHTINVDDNTLPVIATSATSGSLGCNPTVVAPVFTGTDNCEGTITPVVTTSGPTNTGCAYSQTWTANYTDVCLNAALPVSITYTWTDDTAAPVFAACPTAPIDLGCNPATLPYEALAIAAAGSVTDNCDLSLTMSAVGGTITGSCIKSQTWVVTAATDCGPDATCSVTYTWTDDTAAPVFAACPTAPIDLGCNPTTLPSEALAIAAAGSVTDNCDLSLTMSAVGGTITGSCIKSQTWVVTAATDCGPDATCSVTYTWTDDTAAPVFAACPTAPIDLGCNPTTLPFEALAIAAAGSVTDNCDLSLTMSAVGGTITGSCIKSQTWVVTAATDCGPDATCSVTYTWTDDTAAPVFAACPTAPIDLGCNPATLPSEALAIAAAGNVTDNCDATLVMSAVGGTISGTCIKSQTWVVTAATDCGPDATCSVTYTWTDDTAAPVFAACPTAPIDLGCNPATLPYEALAIAAAGSVTDNCDLSLTMSAVGGTITGSCIKSQTWVVTAATDCGPDATCSVTYTWTDDTAAPVFAACPTAPIDLGCNPATLPYEALAIAAAGSVTDNCDLSLTMSAVGGTITGSCIKSQTWVVTAATDCGPDATCSVTYTWTDDTAAPVFAACPTAPIDLGCNPTTLPSEALAIAAAGNVTDNCDLSLTMSAVGGTITGSCIKSQTWVVTAATDCGPDATCSVTYTWTDDTVDPVFTACPAASIDLGCNPTTLPSEALAIAAAGSVTDNCDLSLTMSAVGGTISGTCIKSQTWVVTAATDCGPDATCSVTYTWTDDTAAPVFAACPTAPIDLGCNPATLPYEALAIAAAGSVTDNCDLSLTMSAVGGTITGSCIKSQTWVVTAATDCGPDATCSVTYTWTDDTAAPVFAACPTAPIDLGCNPTTLPSEALAIAAAGNVTDNCDLSLTMSAVGGTITGSCIKSQTWVVTAATDCGPDATCSVTYTWTDDTVDPVFTACPAASIDLGCNPTTLPSEALAIAAAGSVTDNCDLSLTMSAVGGTITGSCIKSQTWVVTAATDCGPDATCSVTYTWTDDTAAPVFAACPTAPIDLGCNPTTLPSEALAIAAAGNVTDNCDLSLTMSAVGGTITGSCIKSQTWVVTAATDCGPDATCSVTYTWTDDTAAPVFAACPTAPIDLGCNPTTLPSEALAIAAAGNVTDNCDLSLTMSAVGGTITGSCIKSQTWVVTAATDCGPDATCSVTYTWTDDTAAPVFAACPTAPIDLGCNPTTLPSEALAIATAGSVTDNCDLSLTMSAVGGTITGSCIKSQTWVVTAATDCGPDATCSVTYTWTDDTAAPVFAACPTAPIDLGCNPTTLPSEALAIAAAGSVTDNCDLSLTMSAVGGTITGSCIKSQTWVVTAATDCGPDATCSVTYTWTDDTAAPVFAACPTAPIDLGCNPTTLPSEALAIAAAGNVTDNCDLSLTMSAVGGTITGSCIKSQTWVVTAATDCGPDATCSVTYTWTDDTAAPVFAACPTAPIDLGCNPTTLPSEALAIATAGSVTDNCDLSLTMSAVGGTITGSCIKSQTWVVTAATDCGPDATCSVTYTWTDDTAAPVFAACPTAPIDLGCNPTTLPSEALAIAAAGSVTDNCDLSLTMSAVGGTITGSCIKSQTWVVTAATDCGPDATCSVTYTWTDDTAAPVFAACPTAPIDLGCNPTTLPSEALAIAAAGNVTDNCDLSLTMSAVGGTITGSCIKSQTWVVTAATDCGPDATCSVTYTWTDDTVDPVFTACPAASIDLGCNPAAITAAQAIASAGAVTDDCGTPTVTAAANGAATNTGCNYTQTWTVTAVDGCGNDATCSVTYTWTVDAVDPVFTACPTASIALGCNPAAITAAQAIASAGAVTDDCGTPTMSAVGGAITGTCSKTQIWTVTATDACGNDATCTVTYTWTQDALAPVVIGTITPTPVEGCSIAAAPAAVTTVADLEALTGNLTITDACTADIDLDVTSADVVSGSYPFVITRTYTITDGCGNSVQVVHTISVDDTTAPTAICQPVTVVLNNGTATVSAAQVNNGSTDNCTIASLSLDITSFTSANIGANPVVLTVTDLAGNSSTCTATVTVQDAVRLSTKVFLGGAYDAANDDMRDDLRFSNLVPTTQPYGSAPYSSTALNYAGTETTTAGVLAVTGGNAVVDWVLLELRSSPATIVARRAALVQVDGDVVDVDGSSPVVFTGQVSGSYYVAIRHRNHMGAMTATALTLSSTPTTIDFTNPATPTYIVNVGSLPQETFDGFTMLWRGNVLHDKRIRYTGFDNDRDPILVAIGGTVPTASLLNVYRIEDVNMDTKVFYTGGGAGGNDRDPILVVVGTTPITGQRREQLP